MGSSSQDIEDDRVQQLACPLNAMAEEGPWLLPSASKEMAG